MAILVFLGLFIWPVGGMRARSRFVYKPLLPGMTRGECTTACGIKTYTSEVNGGNLDFQVGQHVPYEHKPSECFAECETVLQGTPCSKGFTKVAKLIIKLCCKVKVCTWDAGEERYVERLQGHPLLMPLQSMAGRTSVPSNTCLCCQEEVNWGSEVNDKCQHAYSKGHHRSRAIWKEIAAGALSPSKRKKAFAESCLAYCSHFPGYDHYLKTITAKSWVSVTAAQVEQQLRAGIAQVDNGISAEDIEALEMAIGQIDSEHLSGQIDSTLLARAKSSLASAKARSQKESDNRLADALENAANNVRRNQSKAPLAKAEIERALAATNYNLVDEELLDRCRRLLDEFSEIEDTE